MDAKDTPTGLAMKIALVNARYSPNLGDGILAECLERALGELLPESSFVTVDLAGRSAYGDRSENTRIFKLKALEILTGPARGFVALVSLTMLSRFRLRSHFRRAIADCDVVVIGGGNLFSDNDLNFPVKIAGLLGVTRALKLPVAVHAVGVSAHWSRLGRWLFGRALRRARVISVSVRDQGARAAWTRHLAGSGVLEAGVVCDPGLLAGHYAGRSRPAAAVASRTNSGRPLAALCVTSDLALNYHSEQVVGSASLADWYRAVARGLAAAGYAVRLFCNGSPEDVQFLKGPVASGLGADDEHVSVAEPFAVPSALVAFIGEADLVIAHRMHACVTAVSFGIPCIGLRWDDKLANFFAEIGLADRMADNTTSIAELTELARRIAAPATLPHVLHERCRADIAELATILRDVVRARDGLGFASNGGHA